LARIKGTQEYLLRCDHIFAVTKISRAITSQALKSSVGQAISKHVAADFDTNVGRDFNLTVICTRSDVSSVPIHTFKHFLTTEGHQWKHSQTRSWKITAK
jgi:hypothetical protein